MKNNKSVIYWLLSGCILLFIMVTVGGITRLTNSGLSMTDWHLVTDTFPPLTEEKWQAAFDEYKKFLESSYDLNEFETSFRSIVNPYSRIWRKGGLDPNQPFVGAIQVNPVDPFGAE